MSDKRRALLSDIGLLLIRLGFGGVMAASHGWGKLTGFSEKSDVFYDFIGIGSAASLAMAVFAEFFCSLLVMLGLGTRVAVVPLIVTMLVAAFLVHGADPFAKKELALVYLFAFLALAATGPGRFSVDHRIRKLCEAGRSQK